MSDDRDIDPMTALAESRARNAEADRIAKESASVFARLAEHRETNHWAEKTRQAWRGHPA